MSVVSPPEELSIGPPRHGGRHSWGVLIVVTLVAVIVGAICGYLFRSATERSTTATQTINRSPSATAPAGSPSSAPTTPAGMGFGPASAPVEGPPTGHVVFLGARAYHVIGEDRVEQDVIDLGFSGEAPGCVASYVPAPTSAATSTYPPGAAFLRVRCPGVSGITPTENVIGLTPAYPPTKNVIGLVRTGYQDHVLTWIIALRAKTPMGVAVILADWAWVEIGIVT